MQTFLPFADFRLTADVLDVRRLGKQRVETLQILRAVTFDDYGWRNHPAVTMWVGYTEALVTYGAVLIERWRAEGYRDTVLPQLLEFLGGAFASQEQLAVAGRLPPWLGWEALHRSHQAALVRKDPDHYRALFPDVDPQMPYVWPASSPPESDTESVSAWVVRVAPSEVAALRAQSFVGVRPLPGEEFELPLDAARRNTKRRRQLAAFVGVIDVGSRVVVPLGDELLVGEVAGDYEWWTDAPHGLHHARRVRWLGSVPRSALARPAHLQDPRVVFALRSEPAVAA